MHTSQNKKKTTSSEALSYIANYGQIWVLNKNLSYCFLKSMYGKRLNSGGTDSQIFVAENLNVDIP